MKRGMGVMALAACAATMTPAGAAAQRGRPAESTAQCAPAAGAAQRTRGTPSVGNGEYDVVLEIPNLCVDRIQLKVRNVEAHVALDARVANLVRVTAGADASIARVDLGIRGVRGEVLLLVDLDNVVYAVDRALTFIDNNPQVLEGALRSVQSAVGTVGGVANTALQPGGVVDQTVGIVGQTVNNVAAPGGVLSQTVNTLGQTVQTTLDASGSLVERTVDSAGRAVGTRTLGSVTSLPVLRESTDAAGQTVRQVRDTAGRTLEYTVDSAGRIVGSRVVQQATGAAPRP